MLELVCKAELTQKDSYAKIKYILDNGNLSRHQCVQFALYCVTDSFQYFDKQKYPKEYKASKDCLDLLGKWLLDPASVTKKQLKDAANAANAAAYASHAANAANAANAAAYAAAAVYAANYAAANANAAAYAAAAVYAANYAAANANAAYVVKTEQYYNYLVKLICGDKYPLVEMLCDET